MQGRTRKINTNKPRALVTQIRVVHDIICDEIEKKPDYRLHLPKSKKPTRWSSGVCKLCGEHMDCITHLHAERHGYKSAEDLIAAGAIIFD
jgi:hypothetical protein